MLAYISVNGVAAPAAPSFTPAVARADTYNSLVGVAGQTLVVSDPGKGVIANDTNVRGVTLLTPPTNGTVTLNTDGTFTYVPSGTATSDTFTYCANGTVTGTACSSRITATVSLGAATKEANTGITLANDTYTSATGPRTGQPARLAVSPPGVLANDQDGFGYPLSVDPTSISPISVSGSIPLSACTATVTTNCVAVNADGSFAALVAAAGTYTFTYKAKNSQGTTSALSASVSLTFPTATGLKVTVVDGKDKTTQIADYRWIIEEDRTFHVAPNCTTNPPPAGCPSAASGIVPTFGTNFHTSYMPIVATGCVGPAGTAVACEAGQTVFDPKSGTHINAVCDLGNGVCRAGPQQTAVDPGQVHLDPAKRYYISILPGDAGNDFAAGNLSADCVNGVAHATDPASCGHGMGGAPIAASCTPVPPATTCTSTVTPAVTIFTQPAPYPPAKLSVFVFQDDFPLNGEHDGGGGIDVLAINEPGLEGFNIVLFDDAGGTGDATGQMTYDMFNQPLVNSLGGTIDPGTGLDACPISKISRIGANDLTQTGITGTIVTCPKFESDNVTLSPLAGQAVIANLMPGRYGVVATPGADRIARGEEWLQTNTLDGQKAHDSFLRIGEPSFFQEFGPAGYHVSIGFANPRIINSRLKGVCTGTDINITGSYCTNTVMGMITTERMSRTPDERLYSSGSNDSFAFTQCYVSFGDADGEDFAFTKCNPDGSFTLSGVPDGDWRITVFDQWNDMLVDGLSTPIRLDHTKPASGNIGQIAMNQWQANIYTKSFIDLNGDGVAQDNEPGLTLVPTNIRFRDGSYSNFNNTDLAGNAGFNEVFPLFSWYVIESDSTRFKNTGTHVVYDAGGPADGTPCGTAATPPTASCGNSAIGQFLANTAEQVGVPAALRVPGAVYCASADCAGSSIATGPIAGGSSGPVPAGSTGRIDPPWVLSEGWQGFSGQNSFLEFGKKPYTAGENGGIRGEVIYASTRPFDDPQLLLHTSWTPDVAGVTINLYQVGTAADGVTQTLRLVDTTKTTSWDDWAQGFRSDGVPNMNCPGQGRDTGSAADLFFFTLYNQPMYLDVYNNGASAARALPSNSQFKCYDGMHNWNQLQPAPYDGMYQFPSVTARNPVTGKPTATNCTACVSNPDTTDPYRSGTPMLPAGKYVVEMIVPPGYELVKEEDKNILIGDNYVAPVTQEFPGLGSAIYILPDQAQVSAYYNANNAQNPTQYLGRIPSLSSHEGDTGSVESFWPCVGALRIVPDYISLFPQSGEVAPFAGATRNLCDRKLVTLDDQTSALAKFWVFTSTHVAAHFTGVITDDFTSEFDPFSPQFGEKFSPANLPISIKDWTGTEISRVYADQWGTYNGLTYSTWEVNPPNPTGYGPTMMVTCMNDPGTGPASDPLFDPAYSQFCYEIPFMPGQTQYMDTPVVPTSAFAGAGYNNPDCAYPDATPAIKEVDGDGIGPWVSAAGHTLTITGLGDQLVSNYGYSGPAATTAPFNQKTVARHYGFGSTKGTVSIGGVTVPPASITWGDMTITVPVPSGVPGCTIQQQAQYGGSNAQCGELVITAANGKQSIDTVTVTIGGKAPTHVLTAGSIQSAIDAAAPGDLIIVNPGVYSELLLLWKPVRLQGVGAASSIINANTHPAGRLDAWRARVNCLFGLALNGQPINPFPYPFPQSDTQNPLRPNNPYDATGVQACPGTGWNYFGGGPNNPQVDRIPLEGIVGWDTTLNGNLAELLQEPTLMGAYEGAGITVLGKGVRYPAGVNIFGTAGDTAAGSFVAHEGQMPVPTVELTSADCSTSATVPTNPFPSNFQCNPSRIDGLSITNSSQGGGGIFVHGWGHNLEIANNRIYNNTGTMSGGITVGQGESPDALLAGNGGQPLGFNGGVLAGFDQQPWTCVPGAVVNGDQVASPPGFVPNQQLPFCYNLNVNVHHNAVTKNSSIGDELFSSSPAGAGGVTFCTGSDYYKFNYNWLCGNLSTGDGGGLVHLGLIYNGDIEHNQVLFNQSTNPTVPTNGGGIIIMGAAPDGTPPGAAPGLECGSVTDADCAPGLSDGTGPGLVINANLIMGNAAESGSGGGLRFQGVNGTEVLNFPLLAPRWNSVNVTNNIIANNVAGWDGAGVSLQDALVVNLVNNTIVSNDTTASSGMLFNTLGAPIASAPGATNQTTSSTTSAPQPSGLATMRNSPQLTSVLPPLVICPLGHAVGLSIINGACRNFSYPLLYNDVFWQNGSFYIGVGSLGPGSVNQQHVVALYNAFTTTQVATEPTTDATVPNGNGMIISGGAGACVPGTAYWDIGARGDTGPADHSSGVTLAPTYSVLTSTTGYSGLNDTASNPTVVSQYCNGSRTPPEFKSLGYQVPPGISDATVPNPLFNLTPTATVDEGNNWINISWGPLALANPSNNTAFGNYGLAAGSPAINYIPPTALVAYALAPSTDFFGAPRKMNNSPVDVGAVEFKGVIPAPTLTSIAPNTGLRGTTVPVTLTGAALTGATAVNTNAANITVSGVTVVNDTTVRANFAIAPTTVLGAKNVSVTTPGGISNPVTFTVGGPSLTSIAPNTGVRGTSVSVTLTGTNLSDVSAVTVPGTGVTVSGVTVVSATSVTATFTIAGTATLGARSVAVTTSAGGVSNPVTFTVRGATLTSIAPTSATHPSSGSIDVPVTLTGTNLSGATAVTVSGTGVTVSGMTVVSPTTITATFTITSTATLSARSVTVTTPIGTTNGVAFRVN